jgi:hypothetical protein
MISFLNSLISHSTVKLDHLSIFRFAGSHMLLMLASIILKVNNSVGVASVLIFMSPPIFTCDLSLSCFFGGKFHIQEKKDIYKKKTNLAKS